MEVIGVFKRFASKLRDPETRSAALKDREITRKMEERVDSMIYFIFDIGEELRHKFPDTSVIEEIP